MGNKGNNQQQRFQGAAQQQGQKNEKPDTTELPVDGAAAGGAENQSNTGAVQSGGSAEGTASTATATPAPAALQREGDDVGAEQGVVRSEVATAPAVPAIDASEQVVVKEEAPVVALTPVASPVEEVAFTEVPVAAAKISPLAEGILHGFQEYAEAMNPRRPMTVSQGVSYQRRLFRNIQAVINSLEGEDFDVVLGNRQTQIEHHSPGVFGDHALFRHHDGKELNLTPVDRRSFRDILNFLLKIAPLQSRAFVAKQVNLDATFAGTAFTEDGRQRVQNYCRID
jgi:hypothetical protein